MCRPTIPHHNHAEIERIAQDFIRQPMMGMHDGRSLRVEHILESSLCGYSIVPVSGLAEVADAYIAIRGQRIYIDEDQYLNSPFRTRFTLSEELAHIILHVPLFAGKSTDEIMEMQASISDADYQSMEREAKYLAGCLLMPQEDFAERFRHFYEAKSEDTPNERTILLYVFRQLSLDFNVSRHSCAMRAFHLRLIDQAQMDEMAEVFSN